MLGKKISWFKLLQVGGGPTSVSVGFLLPKTTGWVSREPCKKHFRTWLYNCKGSSCIPSSHKGLALPLLAVSSKTQPWGVMKCILGVINQLLKLQLSQVIPWTNFNGFRRWFLTSGAKYRSAVTADHCEKCINKLGENSSQVSFGSADLFSFLVCLVCILR